MESTVRESEMRDCSVRSLLLSVVFATLACVPALGAAQSVADIVAIPGGSSAYFPIGPGQAGDFAFEIRDTTGLGLSGSMGGVLEVPQTVFGQYVFTPLDAGACAAPVVEPFLSSMVVRFAFAPIAPAGTRTCRYRVQRSTASTSDLGFNACLLPSPFTFPFCLNKARIGTLPDIELALDTLGAGGSAGTVVRLRVLNRSAVDVESRVASTACHEFGGGFFGPTSFDLDGDIPDGCARTTGTGCANFTGMNFDSRAFRLGPVPAGGSASCLVRVVPRGTAGLDRVPLFLFEDRVGLPAGEVGFDPVRERETAVIGLGLTGAVSVPVGLPALAWLALLVAVAGLFALGGRRAQLQSM